MPVEELPVASWQTAFGLGFLSSVFDNIPLTALALKQGGYDWGYLAYAVGFGGSMIWFGSSAGVAISNMYPEAKSVGLWLRHGWPVAVAYVVGFFVMLAILGWKPDADHRKRVEPADARAPVVVMSKNPGFTRVCLQLSRMIAQAKLHAGEEISGEFVVARGDGPKVLEFVEEAFDEIAFAIECG